MNKTQTLVVLVSLAMPLTNVRATPQDEQFQQIAHDYIEGYLVTHPENATELGDHRFDDKLTDYSAEARVQELARAKQTRQQLEGLTDLSQLTGFWTSLPSRIRTTIPSSVMRKKSCAKRPSLRNSATSSRCRKSRLRSSSCQSSNADRRLPTVIHQDRSSKMAKDFSRSHRRQKIGAHSVKNRSSRNTTITCAAT